jgi:hypothetical protein
MKLKLNLIFLHMYSGASILHILRGGLNKCKIREIQMLQHKKDCLHHDFGKLFKIYSYMFEH